MKKHVMIATLAVLSTSAFASKARMEALGQNSDTGSHYIQDTRNVFKNPAAVNHMNNYVTFEWGETSNSPSFKDDSGTDLEVDTYTTDKRPEGGFFRKGGAFAYGVYLNSNVRSQNETMIENNSTFLTEDNRVDLFIAGEAGVKWGVRAHFSSNKDEREEVTLSSTTDNSTRSTTYTDVKERTHKTMGLALGIESGAMSAYVNADLKNEAENALDSTGSFTDGATPTAVKGAKWEGDLGLQVGASYKMNDMTFFGEYEKSGADYTSEKGPNNKTTLTNTTMRVGMGKIHKVSESASVMMDVSFVSSKEEEKE